MNRTLCAGLALAVAAALACAALGPKRSGSENPAGARAAPVAVDPQALAIARDSRYQPDVKMLAFCKGETVSVQVQNYSQTPIRVGPLNFGVILQGEKQVRQFDPAVHAARFTEVGLRAGEFATGSLTFTGMGSLAGQKLVFNHAYTRPSVALIQGEGASQPAAAPRTPSAPDAPPATPAPAPDPWPSPASAAPLAIPTPFPDVPAGTGSSRQKAKD